MIGPITFPSTTPHFELPLLAVGQAQKEFFINQALSVLDAWLQGAIDSSATTPPTDPPDGASHRVMAGGQGDWSGHDDAIALRAGGSWTFVSPTPGMKLYDRSEGVTLFYENDWQVGAEPAVPSGGDTIDVEARAAITGLIEVLRAAAILPRST